MSQSASTGSNSGGFLQILVLASVALVASMFLVAMIIYTINPTTMVVSKKYFVSVEEMRSTCPSAKTSAEASAKCMKNSRAIRSIRSKDGEYFHMTQNEWNQVREGDHLLIKQGHLVSINGKPVK
jgi:hypothetical protein